MSNPVPVSVCRALGADIVIAVTLTSDGLGPVAVVTEDASLAALDEIAVGDDRGGRSGRRCGGAFSPAAGCSDDDAARPASPASWSAPSRSRRSGSRGHGSPADPPDVMVDARLSSVGLFDFHRANELIEHGRLVTRRILPDLARALDAWRAGRSL